MLSLMKCVRLVKLSIYCRQWPNGDLYSIDKAILLLQYLLMCYQPGKLAELIAEKKIINTGSNGYLWLSVRLISNHQIKF